MLMLPAHPDSYGPPAHVRQRVLLDGRAPGRVFDGVGAISSSSSRLLFDYPETQRRQILDYLFKPHYGASLQILKVEIGSGTNSTVMSEPSHMPTPGSVDCHRGFEWRLMKDALALNPHIKFYGVMWGAPGWLDGGLWTQDMVRYELAWLSCARANGLHVSYLGAADEKYSSPPQPSFYVALKKALRARFPGVQVVATDEHTPPDYWAAAKTMAGDPAYRDAVDVLGEHDVCGWQAPYRHCAGSRTALSLHKPMWDSEQSTEGAWSGAAALARAMNRDYIDARITGILNWSLVAAFYGDTNVGGIGLMLAEWPWSGYYEVPPSIWVDAQTTQFTQPGWRYIDSASGYLRDGGSYVTLHSPRGGQYSVVIETTDATRPETITLRATGGLSQGPVQVWSTDLASHDPRSWFTHDATLWPSSGQVRVTVEPHEVYTVSTAAGAHRGAAAAPARPPGLDTSLPLPFHQDFEHVPVGHPAPYFQSLQGTFQSEPCAAGRPGRCYQQMVTAPPVLWHQSSIPPSAVAGDPLWLGDYQVSVDAVLLQPGEAVLLGRVDEYNAYGISGYHLRISTTGSWSLYSQDANGQDTMLASGAASISAGTWHQLALRFTGNTITAMLDGQALATVTDDSHTTGQAGVAVSPWVQAQFDDLNVTRTAPWPRFAARRDSPAITATATSAQRTLYLGHVYTPDRAVDGRVESCWMSSLHTSLPQSITVDLGRRYSTDGLIYMPPLSNPPTVITGYRIFLSTDGRHYAEAAHGTWAGTSASKAVSWPRQQARYVRLEATASAGGKQAAACELGVASTPLPAG